MDRREFLLKAFKFGGAMACASLGFSMEEIAWAKCTGYYCGAASSGGGDSYLFRWNGDHASGTSYAYTNSGGGSAQGSIGGAAVIDTTQAHSGNAVQIYDEWDYIGWSSGVSGFVSTSEGSAEIWVYADAEAISSGQVPLFETEYKVSDYLRARIVDGVVSFVHKGNNVKVALATTTTVPAQTYTRIRFRWSVTNNLIGVQIGANDWENDSDADAVTAFANAPTILRIGPGNLDYTVDYTAYIDDFEFINGYNTFND